MLILFTDTDTDITPEIAKEYGYHLISMPYVIDGKLIYPYRDWDVFDGKAFYDRLRGGLLPSTCGLSVEEYESYFEPHFKNGDDILYVHFSRAMSSTFEYMDKAVQNLKEKYPERSFYSIDTKGISIGSYNLVLEIGDLYKANTPVNDILAWAEREVDKFAVYFYADNLKFFARSGRVRGLKAMFGSLLGIRPIITMGSDGVMASIANEKGHTKTLKHLLRTVEELGEDLTKHRVIVAHADAKACAEELGNMLKQHYGEDLNVVYVEVNPTTGAHCGPDSVGVSFHAIHR